MSDKTKFIAFIELHRQKAEKIKVGNGRARAAISDHGEATAQQSRKPLTMRTESQLESIHRELAQTEAAVAAQNLSPDEVQRMNHERETLTRNLDELRTKTAEASQMAYDNEMQVTKSMDRFEQQLQDYTALGHQIEVIQPLSEGITMGPGGVDYNIDLDLGLEDLNEVQTSGRRMRSVIWPALHAYGEGFRKQSLELGNQTIGLDDDYDRLGQTVERQKDEVGTLEVKLKFVHEQAEEAKNVRDALRSDPGSMLIGRSYYTPKRPRRIGPSPSWRQRSQRCQQRVNRAFSPNNHSWRVRRSRESPFLKPRYYLTNQTG